MFFCGSDSSEGVSLYFGSFKLGEKGAVLVLVLAPAKGSWRFRFQFQFLAWRFLPFLVSLEERQENTHTHTHTKSQGISSPPNPQNPWKERGAKKQGNSLWPQVWRFWVAVPVLCLGLPAMMGGWGLSHLLSPW